MSSANSQPAPAPTSTNMTMLALPPQAPPPPEDVEKTATGIPISLIWLPYVAFSIVLLGLMGLSFLHYHKKNGHKYRRRRAELLKQFNTQDVLTQFQGSTPPNGGFKVSNPPMTPQPPVNPYHHRSPKQNPHFQPNSKNTNDDIYPTRRKQPISEPLHKSTSLFRQFSGPSQKQAQPAYSPRGVPLVTPPPKPVNPPPPPPSYKSLPSTSSHKQYNDGPRASVRNQEDGTGHPRPPDRNNRTSSDRGSGGTSDGSSHAKRQKRPITFTSNLNGSMVDVRCGVTDSHKTFRSKNNRSTSLPNSTIWTLPALSSSSRAHHHHHQQYPPPPPPLEYPPYVVAGGGGDYDPAQGMPFSPSGGGLPSIMSDCEDDEAFLLQQTKL